MRKSKFYFSKKRKILYDTFTETKSSSGSSVFLHRAASLKRWAVIHYSSNMNILPVRQNITIVAMEILKKQKKKSKNTDKCDSIEQRKKVLLSLANVQNVQEKGIDNVTCALLFTVD